MRTLFDSIGYAMLGLVLAGALLVSLAPRFGWLLLIVLVFAPVWKHYARSREP